MVCTKSPVLALLLLSLLAGCNSKTKATPENYTSTLNAYFVEHPDCLFAGLKFPYEAGAASANNPTAANPSPAQMKTLVDAQLVEAHEEPAIKITRYTLLPAGERLAPRFCYGHRVVEQILGSTPPAPANGFTETEVRYRYKVEDVPVWARSPGIAGAFPKVAEGTSGDASAKITLALSGVGWSVPE